LFIHEVISWRGLTSVDAARCAKKQSESDTMPESSQNRGIAKEDKPADLDAWLRYKRVDPAAELKRPDVDTGHTA
jgi:hypothetical protein